MEKPLHEGLQALGVSAKNNSNLYAVAENRLGSSLLERFPSPSHSKDSNPAQARMTLHIETSEFTSLCPMTGQPDFAKIIIDYVPHEWCVESKSLKLYFLSFRNEGEFHESVVNRICNDLITLLDPDYIKVTGEFTPRGGIPFHPTVEYYRPQQNASFA